MWACLTTLRDPREGGVPPGAAAEGRRGGPSQACPRVELFDPKCTPLRSSFKYPIRVCLGAMLHFHAGSDPPPPWGSSRRGVPGLPQGKVVRSPPPFLLVLREPNGAQGGPRAIQMEQNGTTRNSHRIARNQACACWRFLAGWICRCLVGVWFHWAPFGSVWFHVVFV